MKFASKYKVILISLLSLVLINVFSCKNLKTEKKQVHLVQDMNGFHSDLQTVVRRSPSVTAVTRLGQHTLTPVADHVFTSNSNTSNSPNIGNLGHSAQIVGKIS